MPKNTDTRDITRRRLMSGSADRSRILAQELIDSEWTVAFCAYEDALQEWCRQNPEGDITKFRFRVGVQIVLRPAGGGDLKVGAAFVFGVRRKTQAHEATVSAHPELPLET